MAGVENVKALTFDVFGTVVDWRGSIIRDLGRFGAEKNLDVDWAAFADSWRSLYQPAMESVRSGGAGWVKLDVLHRQNLDRLVGQYNLKGLDEAELDHMNRVWHRLDPWPDVVSGLARLKSKFILETLSNGNVALMVNMAKRAGLPWDVILGAEVAKHYKPQPEAYLSAADMLGLEPSQCLMVAAHNGDLIAASACGLGTAFVARPTEHGPGQEQDCRAERDYNVVAEDFNDLASALAC